MESKKFLGNPSKKPYNLSMLKTPETERAAKKIQIVFADLIQEETDAIVNAANTRLANIGGVARAIQDAAGKDFEAECEAIGADKGLPTGQALVMRGYDLGAPYVVHAVGPIYNSEPELQEQQLFDAYYNSIRVSVEHNAALEEDSEDPRINSLSFPAISCGIYGYPIEEAAPVAIEALVVALAEFPEIDLVRCVFWEDKRAQDNSKDVFQAELNKFLPGAETEEVESAPAADSDSDSAAPAYKQSVFWQHITPEQQGIVDSAEFPCSAPVLAEIAGIDGDEKIREWYHVGLLPVGKSIGEPEFGPEALIVLFFMDNLPPEQFKVIDSIVCDTREDASDPILLAFGLAMGVKSKAVSDSEDKEFFRSLAKTLLTASNKI